MQARTNYIVNTSARTIATTIHTQRKYSLSVLSVSFSNVARQICLFLQHDTRLSLSATAFLFFKYFPFHCSSLRTETTYAHAHGRVSGREISVISDRVIHIQLDYDALWNFSQLCNKVTSIKICACGALTICTYTMISSISRPHHRAASGERWGGDVMWGL